MRTYFRSILRSFRKNAAKLFSLTFIMLLGIAFVSGLGTLSPSVLDSLGAALDEARVPDLIVKVESASGFTAEQTELLRGLPFVEAAESLTVLDADDGGVNTRICVYSSFDTQLNRLSVEGRLPERAGEVLVERQNNATQSYAPGDAVTVLGAEYTAAGVVSNPLIFDRLGEPSMIGGTLQKIVYFSASEFPLSVPVTDVYVRVAWEGERDYFSDEYAGAAAGFAARVEAALGEGFTVLTLAENKSAATAESYCEKVSVIAAVFPVFFILVAALVVMTTMSRMIEEEREILGCLCSLGAGEGRVAFKYLFPAAVCCLVAAAAGLAVGLTLLPAAILPAFDTVFFLPEAAGAVHPFAGILSAAAMSAVVLAVTAAVCRGSLREQPARLLSAKAPKPGKRILLERVGFLWRRLPFRYKASLRNIFRYKKHLVMTLVSVAGSAALAFAGFGLLNVSDAVDGGSFAGFRDSLRPISFVVVAFGLLLCAFVVYNLTNMNIGERRREIATLGVLGYRRGEILSYVYREILLMAAAGAVFGVGAGCALLHCVLGYLDFGSLADVRWYSYLAAFFSVLCFSGLTDLLLCPKILRIDLTASLKANE